MYFLPSALFLLFSIATAIPIPHNYPYTVGFTRLNFLPSAPIQIQEPSAPLGYHNNQFIYPQQKIYFWTPVIGHANPDENKIVQDDTVTLVNPEEDKLKSNDAVTVEGVVDPNQEAKSQQGFGLIRQDGNQAVPQGHYLFPVQVPSPHLMVPVAVYPGYPGFIQNPFLIPAGEPVKEPTTLVDVLPAEGAVKDEAQLSDTEHSEVVDGLGNEDTTAVFEPEEKSADDTVTLDNPEEKEIKPEDAGDDVTGGESISQGEPEKENESGGSRNDDKADEVKDSDNADYEIPQE